MGRVVLSLALWLCVACGKPAGDSPTYYPYQRLDELTDRDMLSLKARWDQLPYPALPNLFTIDSSWYYDVGDPAEGLMASLHNFEGELVHLPHRVEYPDHPLWYKRNVELEQPGYLYVRADDGSQVYCNDRQVMSASGNFFYINTSGKVEITIRVLNNAMRGGLQQVIFLTTDQFAYYQEAVRDYHLKKQLVQKVLLKAEVDDHWLRLAGEVLDTGKHASARQLIAELEDYPYLTGPYLVKHGDSVRVMVLTEGTARVVMEWGDRPDNLTRQLTTSGPVAAFELGKLDTASYYYYRVRSGGTQTDIMHIERPEPGPFTFNVWADSQSGWHVFSRLMKEINGARDAFGIGIGDLVANGSDSTQWLRFFSILGGSAAKVPYYLVAGNHDYDGYYDDLKPQQYYRYTTNKVAYRHWSYGNAAFIALDPNENFPIGIRPGSKQYDWFYKQLGSEMWNRATWRFVLLHQPPFSQGWAGYEGDKVIRDLLEPLIEPAGIDFILSGHTHDYERLTKNYGSQQVTFLIVGGAGGSLETDGYSPQPRMDTVIRQHHIGRFFIHGAQLRFEAKGLDGRILDFYEQSK